ncbi:ISL3 family transposase [Mesorhizobium sp. M1406]|uniref:ISL3 family transposase n=1 Tax=Mesorhizobium sp. M1406 TaxID=2957099 RepID=UPI0033364BA5
MVRNLRLSSLIPAGLAVEAIAESEGVIAVTARSGAPAGPCPLCRRVSHRIHSRYLRRVSDLPCAGMKVELHLVARRFICDAPLCRRRIFAERFDDCVVAERSRRTSRLECIVHHLGLALGGRPAASFAKRLMVPVSNDTLLRVVRRRACLQTDPLKIVGIDDWAFRRGHRYGTIVCDLERRRIVTLLPDREVATVEAWLADHPQIETVSRDRGGGYGEATAKALPEAVQVADRWHLMENASAAFLDAVRKSMRTIRIAIGATTINPDLLTYAEKRQYEGYLRREETNAAIMKLASEDIPIKEIVRRTGHSRKLVRQVVRGQRTDIFRARQSSLEAWLPFLDGQWKSGCHNASELWRRLKTKGFRGRLGVVSEWARRRRRAEQASDQQLHKVPSARTIARLMTTARDHLNKTDTVMIAVIEAGVPMLVEARNLIAGFHSMIRKKVADELEPWIADASKSLIASFANGIIRDRAAVRAAITEPWSNGQTEGQITKLKLVKRQMYGRGKLDLLQARLIGAA